MKNHQFYELTHERERSKNAGIAIKSPQAKIDANKASQGTTERKVKRRLAQGQTKQTARARFATGGKSEARPRRRRSTHFLRSSNARDECLMFAADTKAR